MKTISLVITFALCSTLVVFTAIPRQANAQQKQIQKERTAPPQSGATAPSGCALLPIALLEKTFGEKFDDEPMEGKMPPAYDGAWGTTCKFSPKPPFSQQHPTTVEFIVFVEASPAAAKQTFDQAAAFLADSTKPKPGIGESSYWALAEKEPRIAVLKGKTHFSLQVNPPNQEKLKELAAAVAAKL